MHNGVGVRGRTPSPPPEAAVLRRAKTDPLRLSVPRTTQGPNFGEHFARWIKHVVAADGSAV